MAFIVLILAFVIAGMILESGDTMGILGRFLFWFSIPWVLLVIVGVWGHQ